VLQKELATAYCKQGIFDEAGLLFLKIQSWQELIDCYTAINDIDKAESIVRDRLAADPSARLWCALGELCERSRIGKKPLANDSDDAISCYSHALQVDRRS
jgi:tetratricopeptide (TPR) repeat protein